MRYAALCLILVGCAGAPATTPKAAPADDPWPECKQIREWFAENIGEPQSFEVIEWQNRRPLEEETSKDGPAIGINLKYRARNKSGAMEVYYAGAVFRKGKALVVNTAPAFP